MYTFLRTSIAFLYLSSFGFVVGTPLFSPLAASAYDGPDEALADSDGSGAREEVVEAEVEEGEEDVLACSRTLAMICGEANVTEAASQRLRWVGSEESGRT